MNTINPAEADNEDLAGRPIVDTGVPKFVKTGRATDPVFHGGSVADAARVEEGQRASRHAWANKRAARLIEATSGVAGAMQGFSSSGVASLSGEGDFAGLKASVAAFLRDAANKVEALP